MQHTVVTHPCKCCSHCIELFSLPHNFDHECTCAFDHSLNELLRKRPKRPAANNESLKRLSKALWSDHEDFEWGTERFDSLQLNAMSNRRTGEYYLAVARESIPITLDKAAAATVVGTGGTHGDSIDQEDEDNAATSPLVYAWQDEHRKAVRVSNALTQRNYR